MVLEWNSKVLSSLMFFCRYLVKCMRGQTENYPDSVEYLERAPEPRHNTGARRFDDLEQLEEVYMRRAYCLVKFATDQVEKSMSNGVDHIGALNEHAVHLVRAAMVSV